MTGISIKVRLFILFIVRGKEMITVKITKEQVNRAKELYNFNELKNSITKGASNIYGAVGEIIVHDHFKTFLEVEFCSTFDYDMKISGQKVEVKTRRTTVMPKGYYNCGIVKSSNHQKCDVYFFVRVMEDFSKGFLLGYLPRSVFYDRATYRKKGEPDGSYFTFKEDGYQLKISELIKFQHHIFA